MEACSSCIEYEDIIRFSLESQLQIQKESIIDYYANDVPALNTKI